MSETVQSKIIHCESYDLAADVDFALFLSKLQTADIEFLQELSFNTLQISLPVLATDLGMEIADLTEMLKKFEAIKLIAIEGDQILVNKERRREFENELVRFNEQSPPGIGFILYLLTKPPIQEVPYWYGISRTSDNLFQSISDKCLATPAIFNRHIQESRFFSENTATILDMVYGCPNYEVSQRELLQTLRISVEELAKELIILEFSFLACVCYKKSTSGFEPFVTPFTEIRTFLQHKNSSTPKSIPENEWSKIAQNQSDPFAFVEDSTHLIQLIDSKKIVLKEEPKTVDDSLLKQLRESDPKWKPLSPEYFQNLFDRLSKFYFIEENQTGLYVTDTGREWATLRVQDRANHFVRNPLLLLPKKLFPAALVSEKRIRDVQSAAKQLIGLGWVTYSDFIKSMSVPLLDPTVLTLIHGATHWKYQLPNYSPDELLFVEHVILGSLWESGIVMKGVYKMVPVLCLTPFGQTLLGD